MNVIGSQIEWEFQKYACLISTGLFPTVVTRTLTTSLLHPQAPDGDVTQSSQLSMDSLHDSRLENKIISGNCKSINYVIVRLSKRKTKIKEELGSPW
jgi:hypothetical protein